MKMKKTKVAVAVAIVLLTTINKVNAAPQTMPIVTSSAWNGSLGLTPPIIKNNLYIPPYNYSWDQTTNIGQGIITLTLNNPRGKTDIGYNFDNAPSKTSANILYSLNASNFSYVDSYYGFKHTYDSSFAPNVEFVAEANIGVLNGDVTLHIGESSVGGVNPTANNFNNITSNLLDYSNVNYVLTNVLANSINLISENSNGPSSATAYLNRVNSSTLSLNLQTNTVLNLQATNAEFSFENDKGLSLNFNGSNQYDMRTKKVELIDVKGMISTQFVLPGQTKDNTFFYGNATKNFYDITPDDEVGGLFMSINNSNDVNNVALFNLSSGNNGTGLGFYSRLINLDIKNTNVQQVKVNSDKVVVSVENNNGQLFNSRLYDSNLQQAKVLNVEAEQSVVNLKGVSFGNNYGMYSSNSTIISSYLSNYYQAYLNGHETLFAEKTNGAIFLGGSSNLNISGNSELGDIYGFSLTQGEEMGRTGVKSSKNSSINTNINILNGATATLNNLYSITNINVMAGGNLTLNRDMYSSYINVYGVLNTGDIVFEKNALYDLSSATGQTITIDGANAVWNVAGSAVPKHTLELILANGGTLNFQNVAGKKGMDFRTLTSSGNSKIRMGAYLDNSGIVDNDVLSIYDVFGVTKLEVYNKGTSYAMLSAPIQLITISGTTGTDGTNYFEMIPLIANGIEYYLERKDGVYSVTSKASTSAPTVPPQNITVQNVIKAPGADLTRNINRLSLNNINNQLTSRVLNPENEKMWGDISYSNSKFDGMKSDVNHIQLGYDFALSNMTLGASFDYGSNSFKSSLTSGKTQGAGLSIYGLNSFANDWFISGIYKYFNGNVKYDNVNGRFDTSSNSFNVKTGKLISLTNGDKLIPYVDYTYGKYKGFTISESETIKWASPDFTLKETKTGLTYEFNNEWKPKVDIALVNTSFLGNSFVDTEMKASINKSGKIVDFTAGVETRFGKLKEKKVNLEIKYKF